MVWGAPTSRSSGGRSAVHTSIGTRARSASTTDGCSSAAAVPLVTTTTAGRPRGHADTERGEAGRALVEPDVQVEARFGGHGQGQWRRPGPGAHDRVADTGPHPLVDQRGGERRLPIAIAGRRGSLGTLTATSYADDLHCMP